MLGGTFWSNQNPESWSMGLLPKESAVPEHQATLGQLPTNLELRPASLQQASFNFFLKEKEPKGKPGVP